MEWLALGISVAAIMIAGLSAIYTKGERDAAREANRIAGAANQSAGAAIHTAQQANELTVGANELTATANQTATDANRIATDALEAARKVVAIEEERREVERRREQSEHRERSEAFIEVHCSGEHLIVSNESKHATARDIVIDLIGPIGHGHLPQRLPTRLTLDELRPGRSGSSERFARVFGIAAAIDLSIRWIDDAGEQERRQQVRLVE
jgi:hypothetical protein